MSKVDNSTFAKKNPQFLAACAVGKIARTTRQASKFRNKRGIAYLTFKQRRAEVNQKMIDSLK